MTSDEIRALQRAAENDIPVERRAEYIATLEVAWQLAKMNERNERDDEDWLKSELQKHRMRGIVPPQRVRS